MGYWVEHDMNIARTKESTLLVEALDASSGTYRHLLHHNNAKPPLSLRLAVFLDRAGIVFLVS